MNPPAKTNGSKFSTLQYAMAAGLFIGGLIAGIVMTLKTDAHSRPDAYTGSDHAVYAETERNREIQEGRLIDERLANLALQIDRLILAMDRHSELPMHAGAALMFARIQRDLAHLIEKVDAIDAKVK